MALPQDIRPINSELMDAITQSADAEWIPNQDDPKRAFMKVLWTGEETGRWIVMFRWLKGYVAPPHKHLSAAHTFILSGKLKVRGEHLMREIMCMKQMAWCTVRRPQWRILSTSLCVMDQ